MHLVVSKNKNTWKSDSKIIFAGAWCFSESIENHRLIEDRKYILNDLSGEINYLDIDKRWKQIFEIKKQIFSLICSTLNEFRNEKQSERYYRILFGHWFDFAIELIFHKTLLAINLNKKYDIKSFSSIISEKYVLAVYSDLEFIDAHFDDRWNQALFNSILESLDFQNIKISKLIDERTSDFTRPTKGNPNFIKNVFKKINLFLENFSSNNDALIINSHLSIVQELKLKLFLKQIPLIYFQRNYTEKIVVNQKLRNDLSHKLLLKINQKDKLLYTIAKLIFQLFPLISLEGHYKLNEFVNKLNWPKHPKFIFTSNSFYGDNVFKMWTAKKVNENRTFFVGQHGPYWLQVNSINNRTYSSCEEITADKLICNGQDNSLNKLTGFNFAYPLPNTLSYDKRGKLSLIVPPLAYFGYKKSWAQVYWDDFSEYNAWRDKVIKFIASLDIKIKENLFLRLYSRIKQHNFINTIWFDEIGKKNIYPEHFSIKQIYRQSRLVIICYESRSLQETMAQNIPTIVFFDEFMIKQMRDDNYDSFLVLKDAGILFTDFLKFKDFLNNIFDNIDEWWFSPLIQEARTKFSKRYAGTEKKPSKFLANLLLKNS